MKIVTLVAENIKKLRAVEIRPTGEIVTITGRNGAGKSSVLDSIWLALKASDAQVAMPIRKGEHRARVRLDMGELVVERRFTESGSQLIVENAEGARFPSPQKMLDALLGELSFDPLAFARMEPRKQFDELRRVSKLDVDIEKLDGLNRSDYAKRTDINRDARAKRAQADAITVAKDLPDCPMDEAALLDEIQKAGEQNTLIERAKARRADAQRTANDKKAAGIRLRERAAELRAEAERLDKQASDMLAEAADIEKQIDDGAPLPEPVNVAEIRVKLEHAKQINAQIQSRDRRQHMQREADALEAQAKQLTEQMEAREQAKAEAIARAEMPVPGLGFGDGLVTFNGVPLEQASSAEQLKVSLAIAMAANPKLRVIRIQDGSLLDDESLAQVAEMAKSGGYQVWIERVDTTGKIGIVIDDGAVVAVDGQPVDKAEAATA